MLILILLIDINIVGTCSIPLMYSRNSNCPKTVPCGMPKSVCTQLEL